MSAVDIGGLSPRTPVVVIKGGDPVLVSDALSRVVEVLVGSDDPSLCVETIGVDQLWPADGAPTVGPLVDAASTPPFLVERRVLVGRGLGGFGRADDLRPLIDYLGDPLATSSLVLVWEKPPGQARTAAVPKALAEAVSAAGGVVIETDPGRKVGEWVRARLGEAPLRLDASATDRVVDHVGEDAALLGGVLQALVAAWGEGARLGVDEVEPYLLEAGSIAPWELTDAIDRGDTPGALDALSRLLGAGRHPLQVMASLHTHYGRMLALDGADVASEKDAATRLGMKGSTFPARKALESARALGHDRVVEFTGLLATADLELRGARAWPDALALEVLVARLASRSPRRRARAGR